MNRSYDIIVVGAGAAGCIAAGFAAQQGKRVLLLDKNARIGRKVMITGKGRCNVTNNCSARDIIAHVRTNPRFLFSALHAFSPEDTMTFFEEQGVALKTERGGRVFPVSDRAVDIVDALDRFVKKSGVIFRQTLVEAISVCEDEFRLDCTEGQPVFGKSVILATGGKSYPLTGSDGSGYRLAQMCGHSIQPTQPSLIPIITCEDWCKRLQGLSLKNVTLTLREKDIGKILFQELGEMLFTHFGVSGPLVLSASSHMDAKRLDAYELLLDFKPGLDEKQLDARLLRDFEKYQNRDFFNALGDLLPRKLIPVIVDLCEVSPDTKVHQITREQRAKLLSLVKSLRMTAKGFRPIEEAIITCGGVTVSEINPKTMESKLLPGLYFAGEMIDVDAYTGGYNLQIAFSTGYAAGMAAADSF